MTITPSRVSCHARVFQRNQLWHILLADRVLTGGGYDAEIWAAFAKRGLGYGAKAPESYTTIGVIEAQALPPALAIESIEVSGGNGNGCIETNEASDLVFQVRNRSTNLAAQVTGRLSVQTPRVTVTQPASAFGDIPPRESRPNPIPFSIQTAPDFVPGTPIDLVLVVESNPLVTTNSVRLYTSPLDSRLLFKNYGGFTVVVTNAAEQGVLTPLDLGNPEPLWMDDQTECLLKISRGDGHGGGRPKRSLSRKMD